MEQGKTNALNQSSNRLWEGFSAIDMHSLKQNAVEAEAHVRSAFVCSVR